MGLRMSYPRRQKVWRSQGVLAEEASPKDNGSFEFVRYFLFTLYFVTIRPQS